MSNFRALQMIYVNRPQNKLQNPVLNPRSGLTYTVALTYTKPTDFRSIKSNGYTRYTPRPPDLNQILKYFPRAQHKLALIYQSTGNPNVQINWQQSWAIVPSIAVSVSFLFCQPANQSIRQSGNPAIRQSIRP